jgi:hypothetical protein
MRVDVSDIVVDFDLGGTTFTRRRPTTTYSGEGIAQQSYDDLTVAGIIQPANTEDAQFLPDGVRLSDVRAFYSSVPVSAGDGSSTIGDVLINDMGHTFQVLHVEGFYKHGMIKALAQRLLPEGSP